MRPTQLFVLPVVLLLSGCGQPRIETTDENVRLLMRLNTAVMSRRADLLDKLEADAKAKWKSGGLTQDAFDRIATIIETGRSGKWEDSQSDCLRFQRAQKPR